MKATLLPNVKFVDIKAETNKRGPLCITTCWLHCPWGESWSHPRSGKFSTAHVCLGQVLGKLILMIHAYAARPQHWLPRHTVEGILFVMLISREELRLVG